MKVVLSKSLGSMPLTETARQRLARRKEITCDQLLGSFKWFEKEFRTDLDLVVVVEELGKLASDSRAELRIVEVPDGIEWELFLIDGMEAVVEMGRSWSWEQGK